VRIDAKEMPAMKVLPQATDEMRRLGEHLEKSERTAMLAFTDEHGQITARPMTAQQMDEGGEIWMLASRKSMAPIFAAAQRQANLTFTDEDKGLYISVAGIARLSDDAERKKALWSTVARPWFPDSVDDPDLVLLAVQPHLADIWGGPESQVVRLIALTASVVAARPIGLGEHEIIKAAASVSRAVPTR
jgi:general stress protein 26